MGSVHKIIHGVERAVGFLNFVFNLLSVAGKQAGYKVLGKYIDDIATPIDKFCFILQGVCVERARSNPQRTSRTARYRLRKRIIRIMGKTYKIKKKNHRLNEARLINNENYGLCYYIIESVRST